MGHTGSGSNPIPKTDWLNRIAYFYFAESENRRYAERLRSKIALNGSLEDLKKEASRRLEWEMGKYPSEDAENPYDDPEEAAQIESSMRQIEQDILENLEETDSFIWGLAIAGLYHVWEQETKTILCWIRSTGRRAIESDNFAEICKK